MRGKRPAAKKEDEIVDLSTLPPWTALRSIVFWHPYLKPFEGQFLASLDRCLLINRETLDTCARERQIFVPASPTDVITASHLAQAFKAKLFELDIQGRKAKKEKIQKQDEDIRKHQEALAKGQTVPPLEVHEFDESRPDVVYLLQGFPETAEEVEEVTKLGIAVNFLMYCKPSQSEHNRLHKVILEEYEAKKADFLSKQAAGVVVPEPEAPRVHSLPHVFKMLQDIAWSAPKPSEHRQFYFKVLEFTGVSQDEGADPKAQFIGRVKEAVEQTALYFVSYHKWCEKTRLTPLWPIPPEEIKVEEPPVVEEVKEPEPVKPTPKQAPQPRKAGAKAEAPVEEVKPVEAPPPRPPPITSYDDLPREVDFNYFTKLNTAPEEQTCNPEFLIACLLQQLSRDKAPAQLEENEALSLEQFFTDQWQRLSSRIQDDNGAPEAVGEALSEGLGDEQVIIEEHDTVLRSAMLQCFADSTIRIADVETGITDLYAVPEVSQFYLPTFTKKSAALRAKERTELYPFSSFPLWELERILVLTKFEEKFKEAQPSREWSFGDRCYEERLSPSTLKQVILQAKLFDPEIMATYYERDDAVLLALYFPNPPGRTVLRSWTGPWRVRPCLTNWIQQLDSHTDLDYYDIDDYKVGLISERAKILCPADNSIIKMTEYTIGPRLPNEEKREVYKTPKYRAHAFKDGIFFGIRNGSKGPEFWANFDDGLRLLTEQDADGSSLSLSLPTGLTVKWCPSGPVMQHKSHGGDENEDYRVVTGMGTVVVHWKNGNISILFANGNTTQRGKDLIWVSTNNKGMRRAKREKDGAEYELDSIPCATVTDPESMARTMTREDKVMVIKYADGSLVTEHADGTKMHTSVDKNTVLVEAPGFAPVKIINDPIKARQRTVIGSGSSDSGLGAEDLMLRSIDGVIVKVFLPDKTEVQSINQRRELPGYEEYANSREHIVRRDDGAVIRANSEGDLVLVTGQTRHLLNNKMSEEAYFHELFTLPDERSSGVYSASLTSGSLWTRDHEGNFFSLAASGKVFSKLSVSLNLDEVLEPSSPKSAEFNEERKDQAFLPPPDTVMEPRLFIVKKDGEGIELLSKTQIEHYLLHKLDAKYYKLNADNAICHTFITSLEKSSLMKGHLEDSPLVNYTVPDVVSKLKHTHEVPDTPSAKAYLYRCLLEYPEITAEKRQEFLENMQKFTDWQEERARQQSQFGVHDERSESQKQQAFEIQQKILSLRNAKDLTAVEPLEAFKARVTDFINEQLQLESAKNAESTSLTEEQKASVQELASLRESPVLKDSRLTPRKALERSTLRTYLGFERYFSSQEGLAFYALMPPKTPDTKLGLKDLSEVIEDNIPEEQLQSYHSLRAALTEQQTSQKTVNQEKSDSPLVSLEPENPYQGTRTKTIRIRPVNKPSVFAEVEKLIVLRDKAEAMAADEYKHTKTKAFDVYGVPRRQKVTVQALRTSSPVKEINEQYIMSDSITDRRVRTSSMAKRLHVKAPSVMQIRKEGWHKTLEKSRLKHETPKQLFETQTMMVTANTADPLRTGLTIYPASARFGIIKQGSIYEIILTLKNEDVQTARFTLRQPKIKEELLVANAKVVYTPSPIAPGMTVKLKVELSAILPAKFETEFEIASKTEIFKVPIFANIMPESDYIRLDEESVRLQGRRIQKKIVKEQRPIDAIVEWNETTTSDVGLPQLPPSIAQRL
mmetsp:Transcript_6797/g.12276  ORF Transcript_6797/g.12276 Transcript_6797/m.12276 type:complete len:1696 (-) Transcript_6797:1566-6653(-)